MRRFAKPLYGLTPVPRVRIPPSPPFLFILHLQAGDIHTDIKVEDRQRTASAISPNESKPTKGYATVQQCFHPTAESGQMWFWSKTGRSDTPKGRITFRGTRESGLSGPPWGRLPKMLRHGASARKPNSTRSTTAVSALPEAGDEHRPVATAVAKFPDETELPRSPRPWPHTRRP